MRVALLPVGDLDAALVEELKAALANAGLDTIVHAALPLPGGAYHRRRKQYRADDFLDLARGVDESHVLAVTDVDLYARPLNFVFGQAEVGGRAAVISLARLAAEDREILLLRALKEAVHELGHNRGLEHCDRPTCVMHFSRDLADTDRKGPGFCAECAEQFGPVLRLAEAG